MKRLLMRGLVTLSVIGMLAAPAQAGEEFPCPPGLDGSVLVRGELWVDETLMWAAVRKRVGADTVDGQKVHPVQARYLEMVCLYENGRSLEFLLPRSTRYCESWNVRGEQASLDFICTENPGGTGRLPPGWIRRSGAN